MNIWTGVGNLTRDVTERTYGDGKTMAIFTLAINDGYGDKQTTDYINIKAFGRTAENCIKYLSKGKKCAVSGRVKTGSYTNKNGDKVYTTDVVADRVEFLEWGEKKQDDIPKGFEAIDDLPF